MQSRIFPSLFALILLSLAMPFASDAQKNNGTLDAVSISRDYYNSIVKILLYDSAAEKTNPDWAYVGRGSGFFVSADGYIFTNRHVIDYCRGYCRYITYNKDEKQEETNLDVYSPSLLLDPNVVKINYTGKTSVIIQVYNNSNGSSYNLYYAKVLVIDTANFDGAILKIVSDMHGNPVTEKFHPVPLGNSDSTEQGEDLCLYGFPAQINGNFNLMLKDLSTLMFGKHSGFDYNINTQYGFIKTDAVINSGNSGGPVFGPSNKVIGIATAAFTKTNIGLIGGINDMYDLVALIPALDKELTATGFTPPEHRPKTSTAILFKPVVLPSIRSLNKVNMVKSGNKVSQSVSLLIGLYGELPHKEIHTIDAYAGTTPAGGPSTNTNGGGSYKIPTYGYGISLEAGSPSILKNQDKNLLTGFFRLKLEQSVLNWTGPDLYTTPYPTAFKMNSSIKSTSFSIFLNACYSHELDNGIVAGIYCGIGLDVADVSDLNIGVATSSGQTANITYSSFNLLFPPLFGLDFKYESFFADISYSIYTEKISYTLPYDYYNSIFYTDYLVGGKIKRDPLFISLGYALYFYPKKH